MKQRDVLEYLEDAYSFLMDPAIGVAIEEIKRLRKKWQSIETAGEVEDSVCLGFIRDKKYGDLFGPIRFQTRRAHDDSLHSAWEVVEGAVSYETGYIVRDWQMSNPVITDWMPIPDPPKTHEATQLKLDLGEGK